MNQSSVSGFHSFESFRFVGFTESLLSDFERIVTEYYKSPVTVAMKQFYIDLNKHLFETKNAHSIELGEFSVTLVNQLFRSYRMAGFTGTKKDMLISILKVLEIGTEKEFLAGVSETKAVTLKNWTSFFKKHSSDKRAHKHIFDTIQPSAVFKKQIDFSFSNLFVELYEIYKEHGFTISNWNKKRGTVFLDLNYDFEGSENTTLDIFRFTFVPFVFGAKFKIEYGVGNIDFFKRVDGVDESIASIPFIYGLKGFDKIIFTFKGNKCTIRDVLGTIEIDNPLGNNSPYSLHLDIPLNNTGIAIKEFTHYNSFIEPEEQIFLIK